MDTNMRLTSRLGFLWTLVSLLADVFIGADALKFGMASGGSSFFYPIRDGWEATCAALGVECDYVPENWPEFLASPYAEDRVENPLHCVPIMRQFIANGVDGIATKCNVGNHSVFHEAKAAGIPVVTFAGPHEEPYDLYVGTNNVYLGRTMARLLKQLRPEGGTYWCASNGNSADERVQGFISEIEKDNHRSDAPKWYEADIPLDTRDLGNSSALRMERMDIVASHGPSAFLFMYQTPMRHPNYTDFVDRHRWRNISLLGTEGNDYQLQYMARHYVHGLIGQLTYDMGELAANTLYKIITEGKDFIPESKEINTQLVSYHLVPEELPPVNIDQSLLGNLRIAGFVCFAIVSICALACIGWSMLHRRGMVVRASQPFFLVMTAAGILITASAMIPQSFDDNGDYLSMTETRSVGICMSIPWLAFIGFTVTFSALFAKTWRVNKFFHSTSSFGRIQVSEQDVLAPFSILLVLNIIILLCWTLIDPLTYIREFGKGTDLWNREISSNGYCRSENVVAFLVPLAMVNLAVLVTACWQAFEACNIQSEFAEAKFIGLSVFSITQGFLTGIPIVVVVRDIPQAFYLVLTLLLFVVCMMVLLLIFVPKILMERRYSKMSPVEQKRAMAVSVRVSSGQHPSRISGMESTPSPQGYNLSQEQSPAVLQEKNGGREEIVSSDGAVAGSTNGPIMSKVFSSEKAGHVSSSDATATESQTERSLDALPTFGSVVERIDPNSAGPAKISTYLSGEEIDA